MKIGFSNFFLLSYYCWLQIFWAVKTHKILPPRSSWRTWPRHSDQWSHATQFPRLEKMFDTRILLFAGQILSTQSNQFQPNILFILADDLGYADVSWNNAQMKTPVLQDLSASGIILDQFYAQPKCSPSRAALMTGKYPFRTSMQRGSIGDFRPTGKNHYKLSHYMPSPAQLITAQFFASFLRSEADKH